MGRENGLTVDGAKFGVIYQNGGLEQELFESKLGSNDDKFLGSKDYETPMITKYRAGLLSSWNDSYGKKEDGVHVPYFSEPVDAIAFWTEENGNFKINGIVAMDKQSLDPVTDLLVEHMKEKGYSYPKVTDSEGKFIEWFNDRYREMQKEFGAYKESPAYSRLKTGDILERIPNEKNIVQERIEYAETGSE